MKTQIQTSDTHNAQSFGEIGRSMDSRTPNLLTVKQFSEKNPAFTEGGLRMYIFYENKNGMTDADVIVRVGRKILIHEENFFKWATTPHKKP
jgi:hypothetical protein